MQKKRSVYLLLVQLWDLVNIIVGKLSSKQKKSNN